MSKKELLSKVEMCSTFRCGYKTPLWDWSLSPPLCANPEVHVFNAWMSRWKESGPLSQYPEGSQ